MQEPPVIFLVGNCQIRFLGAVLETLYPGRIHVVGKPYWAAKPQFFGLTTHFVSEPDAGQLIQRCIDQKSPVVTVRQTSPMSIASLPAGVSPRKLSADVLMPHLEFYCLWPECRGLKAPDDKRIQRLYRGDMAAIENSAKKATVFRNAPEVVATLVKREPCFNSCNHPRGDLFAHMVRELLSALGGDALVVEAAAPLRKLATANATDFDVRHPVPLRYLAALGFDWGAHYEAWAEGSAALERRDFKAANANLESALAGFPESWKLRVDLAQAAFGVGEIERGRAFLEWARVSNLADPGFQSMALYLLLQHGMQPDAVFRRASLAIETHGINGPLYATLARACLKDRALGEPESYARKAFEIAPENGHIACLLAGILWENQRKQDAVDILEDFVAGHGDDDVSVATLAKYRKASWPDRI